jgi:hypothetical protein
MPTSDLVQDLDAMARDFAAVVHSGRGQSDRRVGMGRERSDVSPRQRQRVEASFLEPMRPSDLIRSAVRSSNRKTAQFASKRPWIGRLRFRVLAEFPSKVRTSLQGLCSESPLKRLDFSFRTLASLFVAALISTGAIFVWQSNGVSMTTAPAAEPTGSTFADRVSIQSPAPQAASPQAAQQLEVMARDLASLRRSVQQLTATQEQNNQTIATLQAMTGNQDPATQDVASLQAVIEKQNQMAEEIATLHAIAADLKQKRSSLPLTQTAAPTRPKKPSAVAAKQFVAQSEEPPAPVRLPFLEPSP